MYGTLMTSAISIMSDRGAMIVGHCHAEVVKAVQDAAAQGLVLARRPRPNWIWQKRCAAAAQPGDGASGQLRHRSHDDRDTPGARLYRTQRIIKFEGCYHGHSDGLLVKAAQVR